MILTVKLRKANWIGHSLRSNCRLKHVSERKYVEKDRSEERTRKKA